MGVGVQSKKKVPGTLNKLMYVVQVHIINLRHYVHYVNQEHEKMTVFLYFIICVLYHLCAQMCTFICMYRYSFMVLYVLHYCTCTCTCTCISL